MNRDAGDIGCTEQERRLGKVDHLKQNREGWILHRQHLQADIRSHKHPLARRIVGGDFRPRQRHRGHMREAQRRTRRQLRHRRRLWRTLQHAGRTDVGADRCHPAAKAIGIGGKITIRTNGGRRGIIDQRDEILLRTGGRSGMATGGRQIIGATETGRGITEARHLHQAIGVNHDLVILPQPGSPRRLQHLHAAVQPPPGAEGGRLSGGDNDRFARVQLGARRQRPSLGRLRIIGHIRPCETAHVGRRRTEVAQLEVIACTRRSTGRLRGLHLRHPQIRRRQVAIIQYRHGLACLSRPCSSGDNLGRLRTIDEEVIHGRHVKRHTVFIGRQCHHRRHSRGRRIAGDQLHFQSLRQVARAQQHGRCRRIHRTLAENVGLDDQSQGRRDFRRRAAAFAGRAEITPDPSRCRIEHTRLRRRVARLQHP